MKTTPHIDRVTFTSANAEDRERGLLGFVSFVLDDALLVDGVTVRVTRADRRRTLTFPERRDARGRAHPLLRPIDAAARAAIEAAVLGALGLVGAEDGP